MLIQYAVAPFALHFDHVTKQAAMHMPLGGLKSAELHTVFKTCSNVGVMLHVAKQLSLLILPLSLLRMLCFAFTT